MREALTSFQYIEIAYTKSFQGELKHVGYFGLTLLYTKKKGEISEFNLEMEGIKQPATTAKKQARFKEQPPTFFSLPEKEIEEKRNPYRSIQEVRKCKFIPTFYIFRYQWCVSLVHSIMSIRFYKKELHNTG